MCESYLLKTSRFDRDATWLSIPNRARPRTPVAGDRLFIWDNSKGLIAEAPIAVAGADKFTIHNITIYGDGIPVSWLSGADRNKTTIRSKLRCDRHDRLWILTAGEVAELDQHRRNPT